MTHTITAMKARQNLGEILNRVLLKHDEFIIERGGKPMAAVIPVEKLSEIRSAARLFISQALRKAREAGRGRKVDADAFADEAKHAARKQRARGR